jgi:hypothetical protein
LKSSRGGMARRAKSTKKREEWLGEPRAVEGEGEPRAVEGDGETSQKR